MLSTVARAQLRTVDRNLAEDCSVSDRVLRFDRQRRAALRASPGSDNKNVRLCVDQSALRLVHQTSAFIQAQAQLLQLAIGSFKFSQSDRFAAASTVLNSRLDDHPHHCLHDCLRDNKYIPKSGLAAASGFDYSLGVLSYV